MSTKPLSQSDTAQNACFKNIFDSKLTDAVLITSALALTVIGALNQIGVLQFFGTRTLFILLMAPMVPPLFCFWPK